MHVLALYGHSQKIFFVKYVWNYKSFGDRAYMKKWHHALWNNLLQPTLDPSQTLINSAIHAKDPPYSDNLLVTFNFEIS